MFTKTFLILLLQFASVLHAHARVPSNTLSPVNLRSASSFVILAKTGISTSGSTTIVGNVGISPTSKSALFGFHLNLTRLQIYSVSSIVASPGKIYTASYDPPTPILLEIAIVDMEAAYNDAGNRGQPDYLNPGAGNLNDRTIPSGLYRWTTPVFVGGKVTLSGTADDVWIFQIDDTLTFSPGAEIILQGGAKCSNVFWQAGNDITFGMGSKPQGIFLGKRTVNFNHSANLGCGRVFAQTSVTMISNSITQPVMYDYFQ